MKRAFDLLAILVAAPLWVPVALVVAGLVRVKMGSPVLFRQERTGRGGRPFLLRKFRTMREGEGTDAERLTRFGRFLRASSLDELPELLNVLRGEMSLVGPRPPVPSEVRVYTLEDRKRLDMKPGITCLWQISGRSDIPFSRQVSLDKEYIRSHGFVRDVAILLKTVPAILTGRGAY